MKVTDAIKSDKLTISFEFIPPKKGFTRSSLIQSLEPLMEFNPSFVDVTTHRNDIIFYDSLNHNLGGLIHKKHPSPLAVCTTIRDHFNVEVVPHVLCGGHSKMETEDFLMDLHFLGFENVLALQGDPLSIENKFIPEPDGNRFALDLIQQISNMGKGVYIDPSLVVSENPQFCIGATCYPEGHFTEPTVQYCWSRSTFKLQNSNYLVSQMFFDNDKFFDMTNYIKSHISSDSLVKPIIPGIKILTKPHQLHSIPRAFNVRLTSDLAYCLSQKDSEELGVKFAVLQCKDLIKRGVKHLHFFTMNSDLVVKVLSQIL